MKYWYVLYISYRKGETLLEFGVYPSQHEAREWAQSVVLIHPNWKIVDILESNLSVENNKFDFNCTLG